MSIRPFFTFWVSRRFAKTPYLSVPFSDFMIFHFFKSTTFTFPFSHFWVPRLFRKTTYLSVPFCFHFRFPTFSKKHKNYSSVFGFPVFSPIWRHITFIRPFYFFVSQHFWKTAHLSVPFFISHSANFFFEKQHICPSLFEFSVFSPFLWNTTFIRPFSNILCLGVFFPIFSNIAFIRPF